MTTNTTTDQNTTEAQTETIDARPLNDVSGFQRDLLRTIAALDGPSGSAVQDVIEVAYGEEIRHGRLYTNLDQLVENGLVRKGSIDRRTNSYTITPRGRRELLAHRRWFCSAWGDA